ncbi:MAG: replicative DNA helicase [bacterium]
MSQAKRKTNQTNFPPVMHHSKIPPQNIEAEQAILASILIDNHALNICLEFINADSFYKEAHKIIFKGMLDLGEKNEPIDLVTINVHLDNKGLLDQVGGSAYLSHLVDSIPTAANVSSYAQYVREKSLLRNLINASTEIVGECFESDSDVGELLDRAESKIFALSEKKATKGFTQVKDLVKGTYKQIETLFEQKGHLTGIATGFKDFDQLTAGLQKSDLIIIAGRPSMGKTAFAMNIVENACRTMNAKAAVFSLEMSKESLMMRLLTSQARIDASRVRTGNLDESDWPKLLAAAETMSNLQIYIDDQPAQNTLEVRAKARHLAKTVGGLDIILIDYMQLMQAAGKHQSREQEISEISRSLKALAKDLSVPVIAISQLNRSLESRQNKRPMMSDLRESGAIEQDADLIGFVYRDEVYNPDTPDKGMAEVIIGKQRNGAIGTCRMAFVNKYVRFEDLVYEREYEYEPSDDNMPGDVPIDGNDINPEDVIF